MRPTILALLIVALLLVLAPMPGADTVAPVFPPPPRLATTTAELALVKSGGGFPALRDAAITAADPLVTKPIALPDGPGSWFFYYACADDGTVLRMVTPTDHACPRCGKHYGDERTVAAYRGIQHGEAEAAALALGWAFAYSGNDAYAAQAKRILVKFADDYPRYPARVDRWGRTGFLAFLGGRRRTQSLDEAMGIIPLAKAYDLVRGSPVWSDAERAHVEADFFRLTAQTLQLIPMNRENRQAWYNAGVLAIASVLADPALAEAALHGPSGFHAMLRNDVGDDGMWWEGTMAYQAFALMPLIETVDIARRLGIRLQDEPRFIALLRSPLAATYPDGRFPCVNDSDPSDYHLFDSSFAWAWTTYRDPLFAQALAWADPARLKTLLGADAAPACPLATTTTDLPGIGVAFLRVGNGADAVCVAHHYGQPGGDSTGHGHLDKLGITLFANGREWLADIGRIGYTHQEYKSWARRTIAHNTVTLDQKDQIIDTGRMLWLEGDGDHAACATDSRGAYPGATLRRFLFLTRSMLVDVFEVEAPDATTIDLAAHAITAPLRPGEPQGAEPLASLGDANGYQHLSDIRSYAPTAGSSWIFPSAEDPARRLQVHLVHAPGERIFTATGIGYQATQAAPCLIRRRAGPTARFVGVYDLSGDGAHVRQVDAPAGADPRVRVRTADGIVELAFTATGVVVAHPVE